MSIFEITFVRFFMEEEKKILELEITIKEKTSWGLSHKTFSNREIKNNRVAVIVDVIEYLSENYREDYIKAVRILRKKKGSDSA